MRIFRQYFQSDFHGAFAAVTAVRTKQIPALLMARLPPGTVCKGKIISMFNTLEAVKNLVIEEDLLAGEQFIPNLRTDAI